MLQLLEPGWVLHLTDVLLYHVTPGNVSSTDLVDGMVVEMANGETVDIGVDADGAVTINQSADVVVPDIYADNGVAHVISAVLTPSFLTTTIVDIATSSATTLAQLVTLAELGDALSAPDATLTVRCTRVLLGRWLLRLYSPR